jgi:hypothetical protein
MDGILGIPGPIESYQRDGSRELDAGTRIASVMLT